MALRHLILVFGDQLNLDSAAFTDFDRQIDRVWMAESASEASHVPSTQARIAIFLSAMRHFRAELEAADYPIHYHELELDGPAPSLGELLAAELKNHPPQQVVLVQPGEWRVEQMIREVCDKAGIPIDVRPDHHFLSDQAFFDRWRKGRKELRLEYFYRALRQHHKILLQPDGKPEGGQWNFDADNRKNFGKKGPQNLPLPPHFPPDTLTQEVIHLVQHRFSNHPGNLESFSWPVTRNDAQRALEDFIHHRLPDFGSYQDAMWTQEPFLYHSLLSAAINLKLLDPREVIGAAETAYRNKQAPLNAVEGFIRQIIGWREFVRHIYWSQMPGYPSVNALHAEHPLPDCYWDADTPLTCLRESLHQSLNLGYAHHVQRLMVIGLYSLLLGVRPKEIHEWFLAAYVDAVEWVEMPNVIGMSQFADGGLMSSKPYAATGKYIKRMSNYCQSCPMNPEEASGPTACPFTTLYWDFLRRNHSRLKSNPRMGLQLRNADRLTESQWDAITIRVQEIRQDSSFRTLVPPKTAR